MNWISIIKLLVVALVIGVIALQFKSFKKWLEWGVSEAESYLGSGTGQLKLQYVYNLAIEKFPIFAKLIPFNLFSWLVDKALEKMEEMIKNNKKIYEILVEATEEVIKIE